MRSMANSCFRYPVVEEHGTERYVIMYLLVKSHILGATGR